MTSSKSTPGIRNNNPGNIRLSKDKWQGLAPRQTDDQFFVFKDPTYGIRAMARLLIKYQDDYNLDTVSKIITRWAPPSENDTGAYIRAVCKSTGFSPDQKLDTQKHTDLEALIKAIIHQENGQQPYTDQQITKGLVLAGVEPLRPSLQATTTVKAQQTAAASTSSAIVLDAIQQTIDPAKDAITGVVPYIEWAKYILLAITLISIVVTIYARIEQRKKGIA